MGDPACHLLNAAAGAPAAGQPYKTARLHGRDFWVVPFVSLVEGVLNGSKGPLYYPREEIRKNPGAWNGIPLTAGHPARQDGTPLPGRSPEVAERFQLGWVYNDWVDETRRGGEAWFDKEWTRNKAPNVAAKLDAGKLIELSTGLGTEDYPGEGRDARGRHYVATARNYGPDHLAVLDGQRGACSLADGCGIGRNAEKMTGDMSGPMSGMCPSCGATLNDKGNCPECGWEPGKMTSPWEQAGARTAAKNDDGPSLLGRMWETVVNAVLGQPQSRATGQFKPMGSGTGTGPEHLAAQRGYYAFTPSDQERTLAETAAETDYPGWVQDQTKWARARKIATESGRDQDWPYVVGVYQRIGGMVANGSDCDCGGTCGHCGGSETEGDDSMKTRAENIAFLTANTAAWKGKEAVLNAKAGDKYVFDDATLNVMVGEVQEALNAAKVVTDLRTELAIPEDTALNAMPAFIKKKIDDKKAAEDAADGGADDDQEDSNGNKIKKQTKNRQADQTVNLSNLTPAQLEDAFKKMSGGLTPAEVRNAVDAQKAAEAKEKAVVINQLLSVVPDDKKEARRAALNKKELRELYERYDMLRESGALTTSNTQRDSDDRLPVYGGRLADPTAYNADEMETFDLTTMNWDKTAAGSAA